MTVRIKKPLVCVRVCFELSGRVRLTQISGVGALKREMKTTPTCLLLLDHTQCIGRSADGEMFTAGSSVFVLMGESESASDGCTCRNASRLAALVLQWMQQQQRRGRAKSSVLFLICFMARCRWKDKATASRVIYQHLESVTLINPPRCDECFQNSSCSWG